MSKRIKLLPTTTEPGTKATFIVSFQGFTRGLEVEVKFFEIDDDFTGVGQSHKQLIGSVSGRSDIKDFGPTLTLVPASPPAPSTSRGKANVGFIFEAPTNAQTTQLFIFDLTDDQYDQLEGDFWQIQAMVEDSPGPVFSPPVTVARVRRSVDTRTNAAYDWHAGNDVEFYADACADASKSTGAFHDIAKAIEEAEHFIFIADWSFHASVRLRRASPNDFESSVGKALVEQAEKHKDMVIAIHTWNHPPAGAKDLANNDAGDALARIAGGRRPPNLLWRASQHGNELLATLPVALPPLQAVGMVLSHHQKFVVVDCPPATPQKGRRLIKAFFGGLDLTKGRYDWKDHVLLERDDAASVFTKEVDDNGKKSDDWYNAEFGDNRFAPRQPWHDIHARITGPAAWDIVREFVGRWELNESDPIRPALGDVDDAAKDKVLNKFRQLFDRKRFRQQWEPHAGPWDAQVYRSILRRHWGSRQKVETPAKRGDRHEFEWKSPNSSEASIQMAYLQAINQADRFIYIETQYFIGSGKHWNRRGVKNGVPESIVNRVVDRIERGLPFHAYVVIPMFPEGDPTGSPIRSQRKFEWNTIRYMARAITEALERNGRGDEEWTNYLSFYFLVQWRPTRPLLTADGRQACVTFNKRYMIYVHSKMMIVDDRYAIIGSANLNERSLSGDRDTEICVGLWPGRGQGAACIPQLQRFRERLWREHLGAALPSDWQQPESVSCSAAVLTAATNNYLKFIEGEAPDEKSGHLATWLLSIDKNTKDLTFLKGHEFIPDAENKNDEWRFSPSDGGFLEGSILPE